MPAKTYIFYSSFEWRDLLLVTEVKMKLDNNFSCCEQDKQLAIPDDLGKDGQSVAALQRRLANFEHDLLNLGTQVWKYTACPQ